MKKTKLLLAAAITATAMGTLALTSCGPKKIVVWVGEESATFYDKICQDFLAKEENADFGYQIEVKGMDTGSVAGTITTDPTKAADIYTVAHDNIGKLAAGNYAKPITDKALTDQILADNPESFKNVIYSNLGGQSYLYGAPYISQALFLYNNKDFVTDEQAKSFEGLKEAAAAAGTKAWTVTGDDGYNFSFPLLATKVSDHSTSVKIYEGASSDGKSKGTSHCQGDDTIALTRYMQRSIKDPNGFKFASSDGWDADLRNKGALAVIGGAWHYNTAAAAVSEAKLGLALIPTMTLTAEDVDGLTGVAAGDVYRGGTFADCKVFMINGHSDPAKYEAEQKLIKYLTSKEIQNQSFKEVSNVPAYVGATDYIKGLFDAGEIKENQFKLASCQVEMAEWGIPQPFLTGSLNTFFYSKNAPAVIRALVEGTKYPTTGDVILQDTTSLRGIREGLYMVEYIWMHGKNPQTPFPATLPVVA